MDPSREYGIGHSSTGSAMELMVVEVHYKLSDAEAAQVEVERMQPFQRVHRHPLLAWADIALMAPEMGHGIHTVDFDVKGVCHYAADSSTV